MDSKKKAYEKFKANHPERLAELRRAASKRYYEKHREVVKEKCRERAREKRELENILEIRY